MKAKQGNNCGFIDINHKTLLSYFEREYSRDGHRRSFWIGFEYPPGATTEEINVNEATNAWVYSVLKLNATHRSS